MKRIIFLIALVFLSVSFTQAQKRIGGLLVTEHNGLAVQFTSNTTIHHGQLVAPDTGTGYVKLADSTNAIGVAYLLDKKSTDANENKDSVILGKTLWVVISGTAETRVLTADSANTNKWVRVASTAGFGDILAYDSSSLSQQAGWQVYRRPYQWHSLWFTRVLIQKH